MSWGERKKMNAIIESAEITCGDRGCLDAWIYVKHEDGCQGFGGYALYLPKRWKHHRVESPAGHHIFRIMEIAGVEKWSGLKGKTIRVDADQLGIHGIGHIVDEDWFYPSEDYANLNKAKAS